MEAVVTTGAIWHAKLQSRSTNQHPVFLTGRMPFLSPNQQCQSTEGEPLVPLLFVAFLLSIDVILSFVHLSDHPNPQSRSWHWLSLCGLRSGIDGYVCIRAILVHKSETTEARVSDFDRRQVGPVFSKTWLKEVLSVNFILLWTAGWGPSTGIIHTSPPSQII